MFLSLTINQENMVNCLVLSAGTCKGPHVVHQVVTFQLAPDPDDIERRTILNNIVPVVLVILLCLHHLCSISLRKTLSRQLLRWWRNSIPPFLCKVVQSTTTVDVLCCGSEVASHVLEKRKPPLKNTIEVLRHHSSQP